MIIDPLGHGCMWQFTNVRLCERRVHGCPDRHCDTRNLSIGYRLPDKLKGLAWTSSFWWLHVAGRVDGPVTPYFGELSRVTY